MSTILRPGVTGRDDIANEPLEHESFSEQVGARITPEMHAQILHLVNNDATSYRGSVAKFIRHAIVEMIYAWGMKLPQNNPVSNWTTWDAPQRERAAELARLLKFRGWLSVFEASLRSYINDHDADAVAAELNEVEEFIRSIKGTNAKYWRRKCLGIVASVPAIVDAVRFLGNYPQYNEFVQEISNEWQIA